MSLIILPTKKKTSESYSDLSEILEDNEIHETETVKVAFGIDSIDNIFEAKNLDFESICVLESNGYFYQVLVPFDIVIKAVGKHRDITTVSVDEDKETNPDD